MAPKYRIMAPKYRILEVQQHGRVWYEVQKCTREFDMRGESWDTWTTVKSHVSLDEARQFRARLIAEVRVERVVE